MTFKSATLRLLGFAALALLLAAVLAVRVDRVRARAAAPLLQETPIAVRVAPVQVGTVEKTLTLLGVVEAAQGTDLAPEVTSQVVERLVEPGDLVGQGDLLLRLDATQLAADLEGRLADAAAAGAEAEAARQTWQVEEARNRRDRRLFEGGAISREALDLSGASLARAEAAARGAEEAVRRATETVKAARDRLEKTELRAPWDGEVAFVGLDPGDLALVGRPAVRLVRRGGYRVECRLSQEAARELGPGDPVTVEAAGRQLEARVSRIAGALDPTGLARLEIDVPERPLGVADGGSVRVRLGLASAEGLRVPLLALFEGAQGTIVYRLEGAAGDRVVAVPVEVLLRGGGAALVAGGLGAGDRVVAEHPSILMLLSDGAAVRAVDEVDEIAAAARGPR